MPSHHRVSDIFRMSQATPMLLLTVGMSVMILLKTCLYEKIKEWGYTLSSSVVAVDENLPNFFKAIKLADSEWFVKESRYCRHTYRFSFANRDVVDRVDRMSEVPKKAIHGLAWYNILCNPAYVQAFNYISVATPNRANLIVDDDSDEENDCEQSDMVCILINLAYVRQAVAKQFRFEAGYSKSFGEEMKRAASLKAGLSDRRKYKLSRQSKSSRFGSSQEPDRLLYPSQRGSLCSADSARTFGYTRQVDSQPYTTASHPFSPTARAAETELTKRS